MTSIGDSDMRNSRTGTTSGQAIRTAAAFAIGSLLLTAAGCNGDEAQKAFRGAANGAQQNGALSVATGVIDGAFAVLNLGTTSDPNAASTSTPSGG